MLNYNCNKRDTFLTRNPDIPANEQYKYMPLKKENTWIYQEIEIDVLKKDTQINISTAIYNDTLRRIDFFRNKMLRSYAYWYNEDNEMKCCDGKTLVNYAWLGRTQDSLEIIHKVPTKSKRFQFCGAKFITNLANYSAVKCVKTREIIPQTNGNILIIVNYYGFDIGLVFREEIKLDNNNKILSQTSLSLKSHQF